MVGLISDVVRLWQYNHNWPAFIFHNWDQISFPVFWLMKESLKTKKKTEIEIDFDHEEP